MEFDDILEEIGGFGLYQKWIFFLTCLLYVMDGLFMLNPVFLLGVPLHRCAIPGYDNDTYEVHNKQHADLINQTIPVSDMEGELYDRCQLYTTTTNNSMSNTSMTLSKCDRWVYDRSVFKETFVSQTDMVCDDEIMQATAAMLLYAGMLVGSLVSGILADRFGRKIVMYVSVLIMTAATIGITWANSYALFGFLQFVIGATTIATFMPAYLISMELTSARKRSIPGVICEFPYTVGLLILAAVAYGLRDWKWVAFYTAIPGVLFISYWWLIPESPRWLLSKGRVKEAEVIIRRAAKWNKKVLHQDMLEKLNVTEDKKSNFTALFSTQTMCIRTVLIFFNWMVVSFAYFGLSLNTSNLNGDLYLNFAISGLVEAPGYLIVLLLIDRIGRRWLYFWLMLVGGIACVSTIFTVEYGSEDLSILTNILAYTGKLCITAGFAHQYVHSMELFPTVIRNAGMGGASLFARAGTMVAPYIVIFGESFGGSWDLVLPMLIFGGMSILSAVTSLYLPETVNRNLPETLEDAEYFEKKNKKGPDESPPVMSSKM